MHENDAGDETAKKNNLSRNGELALSKQACAFQLVAMPVISISSSAVGHVQMAGNAHHNF